MAAFRRLGVVKQADTQGTEEEVELASGPPGPNQTFLAHVESSRMFVQPCVSDATLGNDGKTGNLSGNLASSSLSDDLKGSPPSPLAMLQPAQGGSPGDTSLLPSTPPQLHEGTGGTRDRLDQSAQSPTSPGPARGPKKAVPELPSMASLKKGPKREGSKKRGAGNIGGLQLRDNELLELGDRYHSEAAVAELVLRIQRYIIA